MLRLILLEKRTLLRGWLVASLLVFPFTFLPVLFKEGALLERLTTRAPESLLYATGFSLLLVIAAVYYNFETFKKRIRLFKKPAFRQLDFELKTAGHRSIHQELELFLQGERNGFHYAIRLQFDFDDKDRGYILIMPLFHIPPHIDGEKIVAEIHQLLSKDFKTGNHPTQLELFLPLEEKRLDDPMYLYKYMSLIEAKLRLYSKPSN